MKTKDSLARGPVILGNGSSTVVRHLLGQGVLITTFGVEVIVVKKVLTFPIIRSRRGPVWRTIAAGTSGQTLPAPPDRTKDDKDNDTEDDDMLVSK